MRGLRGLTTRAPVVRPHEHDRDGRRFVLSLHGRVATRRYALIHTGGQQWLIHLTKDQPHIEE